MEEDLDAEIASLRAELHNQKAHHHYLTASLLTSTSLQKHLQPDSTTWEDIDISPLAQTANTHSVSNHHRVAFSATSFPFTDPDPTQTQNKSLLGIRIDITGRNGRYTKPYYVLLARVHTGNVKRVRVYRHTIPAFISLDRLERVYLTRLRNPESGTDETENLKPWKSTHRKQDLAGFIRALRTEIVAWQRRRDVISFLRGRLGLSRDEGDGDDDSPEILDRELRRAIDGLGIVSLAATALEARYVRVEWEDGRVGRFKISNSGSVERAVVLGDRGRDKGVEEAMKGGDGRVEMVLERLMERMARSV